MSELTKFIIKDNETQYDASWGDNKECLYEIYGISESGVLFERDLQNPERLLRHCSNGVKSIDYNLNRYESFFRKNNDDSHFFSSYTDYDDYTYSKGPKQLSDNEMVGILKEYVYLYSPNIGSKTLMGWRRDDGDNSPLLDPNWCHALVQLDDKKDYTIIKREDTVKLFEGRVNMYHFDDHDELTVVKFTLERDLYEKALDLSFLRRKIATSMYGKVDISRLKEFIDLHDEIVDKLLTNCDL